MESLIKAHPKAKGVLLGHHGMSSWNNDDKVCYETALEIVDRAAAYIEERDRGEKTFGGPKYKPLADEERRAPDRGPHPVAPRPGLDPQARVGTVQDDPKMLRFVDSVDGPRLANLGTSCPDHFLRTKIKPSFVDWNPESGDVEALKASITAGPGAVPQGLRGLLRALQAPRLARDARPQPDGRPDPGPRA